MIGQSVQNYKIVAHLGEGGMGVVYKAVDNVLGREVALKMLHASMIRQEQVLERFKKEAQVLARLLHPNIAVIYNFIEQDGQFFMVMEYVEGKNLDELARAHHALPHKTIVAIFLQALEGLHHAHRRGIFHRDIKPSNLILTPEGTLKLMDFGIAKIAGEQKLTQLNRVIGTIEFMAPEIIEGKDPSVSSDIYAAGITMYELLSGRLPFESASDYTMMQDILKKKPQPLSALNPSVPAALNAIVMKALEKKPANRYPDAKAFQQALFNAFPDCKDADLGILAPAAQSLYQTREENTGAFAGGNPTVLSSVETRLQSTTRLATGVKNFDQKVLLNKRLPYLMAGAGIIIFLVAFLSVKMGKKPAGNEVKTLAVITDSIKKNDNTGGSLHFPEPPAPLHPTNEPVHVIALPEEKKDDQADEKIAKKEADKKTAKKEASKKEVSKKETIIPVVAEKQEKPDPPPVEKKVEKKEVNIDGKVMVTVSMRETITKDEDDKEQSVSFTVTTPVVYNGITIINAGAVAKGNIRIGRVVSLVSITSVMGANGQEIALNGRDHRKVKKLASDREYRAFVEKGTRMTF